MLLKKRATKAKKQDTPGHKAKHLKRRGSLTLPKDRKSFGSKNPDPDRPLTDQEWTMLKHYASMEVPDLYRAYKLAGFGAVGSGGMQSAMEIFQNPAFQKALEDEVNERKQIMRVEINAVIRNLVNMANANMDDYATWQNGTVCLKDSSQLTRSQKYAIIEVKDTAQGVQIKLDSRQRALEMLATHLGFLIPDPSKTKDVRETAQQIKEAADALFNSVPTEPPATPTPSASNPGESE